MSSHLVPHSDLLVFVERSPAAMALFDKEMRYLAYSERWVKDFKLGDEGDLHGRLHFEVIPDLPEEWKTTHVQRALEGHVVQGERDHFGRSDGTIQHLRYEVRPWHSGEEIGGLVILTEDLTEYVQAVEKEKAARESVGDLRAQQTALYAAARDVEATLWAFDADLKMTLHVGAPLEKLGVGQGWNVGENMAEVYAELPGFIEMLHRVLEGEREQIQVEVGERMFETVVSPIRNEGEVLGGVGISIDVTDRNLRTKEAAEYARRLRALADTFAVSAGSVLDQATHALGTVRTLLGLDIGILSRVISEDDRYEVIACSVPEEVDMTSGDAFSLGATYCSITLDQNDVVAIDEMAASKHHRHPCYKAFGLESYIGAPVTVDGQVVGTINFSSADPRTTPFSETDRDLVRLAARWAGGLLEREARERRLQQSEQRFRGIFNSQFQFQGLLSPDGTLIEANDTAVHFSGLERSELIGKKFWDCHWWLVSERTQNQLRRAVEQAAKGEFVRYTVEVQGAQGDLVPIDFSIKPLLHEETGEVILLIPEGRVIAEIIEAQERLEKTVQALAEARDEAEAANRAKSAFLAAMSHEIRTPMNAVVGYSDLLGTTSLDPMQQDYLATIQRASDRLLRLIDDVLDFSKIEAERIELETAPFEVEPLVMSVLEQFAPQASEKNVELAYIPPVPPHIPPLLGDEKRIHQVLSNLVSNAVKFTAEGTVELAVRAQSDEDESRLDLEIDVRDTGIGIAGNRLEEVFEPFVQADSSTTRQFGGTGLGLAISRQFVERMGGTLHVESEEGAGSTFRVRLPLALADAAMRRVVTTDFGSLAGLRALVVDDQRESLALTVAHCKRWGLVIESTIDPEEALRWLDEGRRYDIAVLDMEMPGMDGIMLAKAIRERDAALPLAVLSSATELGDAAASVDAIAVKPIAPEALKALFHKAIRRAAQAQHMTPIIRFHETPPRLSLPDDADEQRSERLRILVAEDEPDNQKLTLQMLRLLGYEAHIVASGLEALEHLHASTYDIVLMDVMMPGMDGLEATRRLRSELLPASQPRVVALTARALRSDREACLAAGMDDYLSKPIRIGDLARALSAVSA